MSFDPEKYNNALDATRYIQAYYLSELSFVLHLPFFTIGKIDANLEPPKPISIKKKLENWWRAIQDKQHRRSLLIDIGKKRIYSNFHMVQTLIFVTRVILNYTAYFLITADLFHISGNVDTVQQDTENAVLKSSSAIQGWHLIILSTAIYFIGYSHHRFYLVHQIMAGDPNKAMLDYRFYTFVHLSFVNFSIDFPGIVVPAVNFSRWIITIINIIAGTILIITLLIQIPIIKAWGCYPKWESNFEDLQYGMCSKINSDPQSVLQPVCTMPGTNCGDNEIRVKDMFGMTMTIVQTMLSVSFIMYWLSIPVKLTYYRYMFDLVQATKTKLD
jgi:hypothetical protein